MSSAALQKRSGFIERLVLAFANLTGVMICISLVFTVLSDVHPDDPRLFEITGRFALFVALIGCLLAAASAKIRFLSTADAGVTPLQRTRFSIIMGFLSVVITAAIIGFQGKLQYYEWISVLFVGVATGILTFETTLTSPSIGAKDAIRTWWVYRTYGVIALFSLVSVLFRVLLPENVLTNVIIAPLQMFLIPGLSLAIALLPVSASWIDYLAYGIPLSLGSQLVGLIWLDWVGIVVSTSTIYILAGCITLISFLIANYRAAHT